MSHIELKAKGLYGQQSATKTKKVSPIRELSVGRYGLQQTQLISADKSKEGCPEFQSAKKVY